MKSRGFTLLEVLIALAIIAVSLAAALRATSVTTDGSLLLKQKLLAQWSAENRLAELQARKAWPAPGVKEGETAQAGLNFIWEESVGNTPNTSFRRVEIKVYQGKDKSYALAQLVGYLANPAAPVP